MRINNEDIVVIANKFCRETANNLKLTPYRFLNYAISKVQYNDDPLTLYTVPLQECYEAFNIQGTVQRELLRSAIKELQTAGFCYINDIETYYSFFSKVSIDYKQKQIQFRFGYDMMKDFIFAMKDYFSKAKLETILSLPSTYAVRIFQLLNSYIYDNQDTAQVNISVEDLKLAILSPYKTYGEMKRRAIIPSIEAINRIAPFVVDFEEIKVKNRVESITFTIDKLMD